MKKRTYKFVYEFKKKFPKTVAFRTKKHAKVIDLHLNELLPNQKCTFGTLH